MPDPRKFPKLPHAIHRPTLGNYLRPEQVTQQMKKIFELGEIPSSIAHAILQSFPIHERGLLWKGNKVTRNTYINGFIQAASSKNPQFSIDENYRPVTVAGFSSGKAFFIHNPELEKAVAKEKVCDIFELVRPKVNQRILQAKQNMHGTKRPGPSRGR